jgi:hypothetical protein
LTCRRKRLSLVLMRQIDGTSRCRRPFCLHILRFLSLCPASLVTHFSANVCCVDRWLHAGCELMPHRFIIPFHTSQPSARHVGCLRISRSTLTGVMAKPRKKTAALESPPMPQVGDKVYPPNYEMVYEISKVHCGGDEIDLHVPGTNLERFRGAPIVSSSSNASLRP